MGTPQFSVPVLEAILAAGHEVVAVYTQPPRPAGRGMAESKSPVHAAAGKHGLTVITPKNFKAEEDRAVFAGLRADAAVVVAYGLLLPEAVLNAPRLGCYNLHASKLPRWRGAAPIQRAIMAGDDVTAVMVMRMEKGLDTGPICLSHEIAITEDMTAADAPRRSFASWCAVDGGGVAPARSRDVAPDAATRTRCDLRGQDRQGGSTHRLRAARARGGCSHSRAVAVSRSLDQHRQRQHPRTSQSAQCRRSPGHWRAGRGSRWRV